MYETFMALSHEHVGPKIAANIKVYTLTRPELLCSLCYRHPEVLRFTKKIRDSIINKRKIKKIVINMPVKVNLL